MSLPFCSGGLLQLCVFQLVHRRDAVEVSAHRLLCSLLGWSIKLLTAEVPANTV